MPQAHNIGNDSVVVGASVKDALDLLATLNGAPAGMRAVSGAGIAVLPTDNTLVVANSGATASIQLPNPATRVGPITVVGRATPALTANRITFLRFGSEQIDGSAASVFYLEQSVTLVTDGTNWFSTARTTRYPVQTSITPTNLGGVNIGLLNPTDWAAAQIVRLASTAPITISALQTGAAAYPKLLLNENAADALTFVHEDAGQTASERIRCPGGVNFPLGPSTLGAAAWAVYDNTAQRWLITTVASPSVFNGAFISDKTITPTGTTGAQTIDKAAGTVNFAAGASALVVTNALVTSNSIVLAVVRSNDASAQIKNVVPGASNFTINLVSPATAETSVGFVVHN